jgi:predicted kinase
MMIVIVFGLPGSGKSYFAMRIAQMLNAKYVSSDSVRKEVFATPDYSSEGKTLVYDEMLRRAIEAAEHGKVVVLDATFFSAGVRQKFINCLQKLTNVFWIEVNADESLVKERLKLPRQDSDANFEVYQVLKSKWESPGKNHLTLTSTDNNITEMLEQAADYLFSKYDTTKH